MMPWQVDVVLGTGSWETGCQPGVCGPDKSDVSGGRVVFKVYQRLGGPNSCLTDGSPNATLGPNAVRGTVDGETTTWEIRYPGNNFSQPGNVFVDVTTESPSALQDARAVVASFGWSLPPGQDTAPVCASSGP
jgi:hypothetical protein